MKQKRKPTEVTKQSRWTRVSTKQHPVVFDGTKSWVDMMWDDYLSGDADAGQALRKIYNDPELCATFSSIQYDTLRLLQSAASAPAKTADPLTAEEIDQLLRGLQEKNPDNLSS